MYASKLTPEQRIQKSVVDIMANRDFTPLAGILMLGNRRVEHDPAKCPTAYTDGKNVVFGADLISKLNDRMLRFVDLHEQYHKMYRHLTTWRHLFDENPQLANAACDYRINLDLHDYDPSYTWIEYPRWEIAPGKLNDVLIDTKYRNWSAQEIYNDLKKKYPPQPRGGQGQGQGSEPPEGFDVHDWEAAKDMSVEDKKALERDIDQAIRQGAKIAGKNGSAGVNRHLGELLKPKVDWRGALSEFVSSTTSGRDYSTWAKPNRRFISSGVYMPSGITETVDLFLFGIDASGSMGNDDLNICAGGVVDAVKAVRPKKMIIVYWDGAVCGVEEYNEHEIDDFERITRPNGGGSTRVEVVCDYIQENKLNPDAAIIMTDGYLGGTWGTWHCPLLWMILDNDNATPDIGKTIHVNSRDL